MSTTETIPDARLWALADAIWAELHHLHAEGVPTCPEIKAAIVRALARQSPALNDGL